MVDLVDAQDAVPLVDGFEDLRRAPGSHQGPVFVVAGAETDVFGLCASGAQGEEETSVHLVGQDGEVQTAGRQDLDLGQAKVTVQRQEIPRDDLGMSHGKGLGLEHVRVEGGDVVIPYLQGIVHLPVKSEGVGPSAVKGPTGLQSVLQVLGVGKVAEFVVRPQSLQKVVLPHHGEFQTAGAEVGLFLLRQEVEFGHGLSGDGVLGRGAVAGVTDGAPVPETAVVFERFVLLLVVAVHPVGSELLFAAVGQGVSQVGQSPFQGRPLQPQDAVLRKLTAGHVALWGDGGHGGGEEGFGGHVVFGPSVRQGPTSVPEGGQVSTSVCASHGPGLRQELGLEHLVGHGGHSQTGEGVHAGGLEHQTPVFQTGFFQDVDVAVAVGHQLLLEVEFQGADGGVPIEEGVAVRGSHAVGAVEGGIQVGAHVVPEARFVGQVGKVSLATLRQAEGLGQGGQLHGKEVERVEKSEVQAPPHLHVHQLGAVEQHGLGTHGLGDQVVQDQISVESLGVVGNASKSRVALGKQANEEVPGLVEDVTTEQGTAGTGTGASGTQRSAALATFGVRVVTGGTDGVGHHQIGHVSSSTAYVRETVSTDPAGVTKEVFRAVGTVRLGLAVVAFLAFVQLVLTRLEVVKHVLGRIGRNGRQGSLETQVAGLDEIGAGGTLVLSAGVQGLSVRGHFLVALSATVTRFA